MYKRIVLAYNGSQAGQKALLECREIAQWSQSELLLIAVMPHSLGMVGAEGAVYVTPPVNEDKSEYQAVLDDGLRRLSAAGFQAQGEVLVGEAVEEITGYARKVHADLVVVGHQHLDGWAKRWWKGSISGSLIAHSPCSVLVVILC
jgi:nucleotide-binding universal stress UspA family protein